MSFNLLNSFKSRIFALVVALIITVLAISLLIFYQAIIEVENERFKNDLNNARNTVAIYLDERKRQFSNSQESISKAIVSGGMFIEGESVGTINSFLASLINRSQSDLIMAINLDGKIIGQVLRVPDPDNPSRTALRNGPESGQDYRMPLDSNDSESNLGIYQINGQYYQFTLSLAKAGPEAIGWIGYGYLLDQRLTTTLHKDYANGNHVNFVLRATDNSSNCQLIASSKPGTEITQSNSCDTSTQTMQMAETPIVIGDYGAAEFMAVIYGSRTTLIEAVSERLEIFYTLLGIVLLASVIGVYLIASIISKPVQLLAEKARIIASGHYNEPVVLNDAGELGQLASEINLMQKAVVEREQAIIHQSSHDPITDLPNRNKLFDKLQQWYDENQRDHGLMLIRVDHINEINESLGHETGESVVQFVAERLRTLEDVELLSHLRAYEFVLLVKLRNKSAVLRWVDQVTSLMETPFKTKGMTLHLSVCIGIAQDFNERYQPGLFLRMADSALQMARKSKVPFKLYDQSLDQEQSERLALMNELRTAIEENHLLLHYQPKLCAETNKIYQVEALIRWQHPERGMIRPDKFISIAENSGQMDALSTWVLETAVKQHLAWKALGMTITIAINISAENLKNDTFYHSLKFVIEQYKLAPSAIQLEVTESAVVEDPESAIELLTRFKNLGLHLSIDDYGTGYSSLAQLKQLPVDELKIDMSFIQKLPDDEDDKTIVQSTIELAHNMGLTVVAEGVETKPALEWLTDHGCDVIQGYYISKPISGDEFEAWYAESNYSK